jgi:hypothetical protein
VTTGSSRPLRVIVSGVAAGTEGLELRLPVDDSPPTGTVEGRVTEAGSGARVPAFRVVLRRGAETLASAFAGADAEGRFSLAAVPAGPARVEVRAEGFLLHEIASVEIRPGATLTLPPIALDRGVTVTGKVRGPADVPWKGRRLWLRALDAKSGTPSVVANVEDEGTFRASGLAAGKYRVTSPPERAWEKGAVPLVPADGATLVIPEGSTDARFEGDFVVGGTLSIAAMDPRLPPPSFSGLPASEAQTKFGTETRVRVTGPDGNAVLDVTGVHQGGILGNAGVLTLVPGRYVARIDFPGGESREETVALEAGANVSVNFQKR